MVKHWDSSSKKSTQTCTDIDSIADIAVCNCVSQYPALQTCSLDFQCPVPHFLLLFFSFLTFLYLFPPSLLSMEDEPMADEETELDVQLNSSYLKALEGFLMVLSEDGDMIYLSETVNKCLGLAQVGPIWPAVSIEHRGKGIRFVGNEGRSRTFSSQECYCFYNVIQKINIRMVIDKFLQILLNKHLHIRHFTEKVSKSAHTVNYKLLHVHGKRTHIHSFRCSLTWPDTVCLTTYIPVTRRSWGRCWCTEQVRVPSGQRQALCQVC